MPWRFQGRAQTDASNPRAHGSCDRCGFRWNLYQLQYQYQWAGTDLINLRIRVCPTCLDKPSEFLRTIIIPPDPVPAFDPRPEPFAFDEIDYRVTEELDQRVTQNDLDRVLESTGSEDYTPTPDFIVIASTAQMLWTGYDATVLYTFAVGTAGMTWTGPAPTSTGFIDVDAMMWGADVLCWGADEMIWASSYLTKWDIDDLSWANDDLTWG